MKGQIFTTEATYTYRRWNHNHFGPTDIENLLGLFTAYPLKMLPEIQVAERSPIIYNSISKFLRSNLIWGSYIRPEIHNDIFESCEHFLLSANRTSGNKMFALFPVLSSLSISNIFTKNEYEVTTNLYNGKEPYYDLKRCFFLFYWYLFNEALHSLDLGDELNGVFFHIRFFRRL